MAADLSYPRGWWLYLGSDRWRRCRKRPQMMNVRSVRSRSTVDARIVYHSDVTRWLITAACVHRSPPTPVIVSRSGKTDTR